MELKFKNGSKIQSIGSGTNKRSIRGIAQLRQMVSEFGNMDLSNKPERQVNKMCAYCDPNSDKCCIYEDSLTSDYYLDIQTYEWDYYDDDFIHQREYISYCPYCGRKLVEK